MSALWLLPVFVLGGAVANRHRGGWIGTGHTEVARADFSALITALFCFGAGLAVLIPLGWVKLLILAAILFFGTFLGSVIGHAQDMGDDTPGKAVGLAASGAGNMAACFVAAAWLILGAPLSFEQFHAVLATAFVPPQVVLCALTLAIPAVGKPFSYWIGKHLPQKQLLIFGQVFWGGSTEWGEVLFGAFEGLMIWSVCAVIHL